METKKVLSNELKENGASQKQNNAVPLQDNRPKTVVQRQINNTGLPNNLKSGIENLSGHSMDDVKVHYNSSKPAQLNAHAYAQGTDIHVAAGQEKHVPHEAWHVVQQKQGRVKPTKQLKAKVNINDDIGLEKEADVMGAKALQMKGDISPRLTLNRNVTVGKVAQRHTTTKNFKATKNSSSPLFSEQGSRPVLMSKSSWHSLWMTPVHHLAFPVSEKAASNTSLLVADDKTMAINKTDKEPKEFYATPSIFKKSNQKLENVHSTVRLVGHSNSLTVGGKTLEMITAKQIREPKKDFDDLLNYECFRVAAEVIGMKGQTQSEIVLGNKRTEQTVGVNPGPTKDIAVNKLAKGLADSNSQMGVGDAVNEAKNGSEASLEKGEKYGKRLGKGQLSQQANRIKVNEFAKADVGEAYATFTIAADQTRLKDFSKMVTRKKPTTQKQVWGYHYAGVIAKSQDGRDSVTLENYNRRDDILARAPEIKAALLAKFRNRLGQNYAHINQTDPDQLYATFHGSQGIVKEFMDDYMRILNSAQPNKAWYFAMYGSKKGQTFHEKQAKTGFFSNPLTLRVRKLLAEAKSDWNKELTQQIADLQSYTNGRHNATTKMIIGKGVVKAIKNMRTAISHVNSTQDLQKVKLLLSVGDLNAVIKATNTDSKNLTIQSIGAERPLSHIASDFSPRFDLVNEQLALQKVEKIMERLKNMV